MLTKRHNAALRIAVAANDWNTMHSLRARYVWRRDDRQRRLMARAMAAILGSDDELLAELSA